MKFGYTLRVQLYAVIASPIVVCGAGILPDIFLFITTLRNVRLRYAPSRPWLDAGRGIVDQRLVNLSALANA
jgi:hypothetical protein